MEQTNNEYTNKELAEDYYRVVIQRGVGFREYSIVKKTILSLDVDIPSFYREKKNLESLKVRGIGKATKKILGLILENGFERAKELYYEELITEARRSVRDRARDDLERKS